MNWQWTSIYIFIRSFQLLFSDLPRYPPKIQYHSKPSINKKASTKMNDSDIIARVYPHSTNSNIASRAIAASSLCTHPPQDIDETPYSRSERERTEPPEDLNEPLPCAEIRFSNVPRTGRGILIGSHPDCDIVVSKRGISSRHISLTFDEQRRFIVKDWGSLIGTQVTYDGQGVGKRSKFQWIIGGAEIPRNTDNIILEMRSDISFLIVVPQYDTSCPEYMEKADCFCRGTAPAEELLVDLDLVSRPMTMAPTGVNTPGTDDIYLKKRLGEGSFGEVTHLWNVSTGQEYALKTPSEKAIKRGHVDVAAWRREARIMGQVSHASIPLLSIPCFTNVFVFIAPYYYAT